MCPVRRLDAALAQTAPTTQRMDSIEHGERPWTLLLRGTRDGFGRDDRLCDEKGPTIIVARIRGAHLVGGFTLVAWGSPEYSQELYQNGPVWRPTR